MHLNIVITLPDVYLLLHARQQTNQNLHRRVAIRGDGEIITRYKLLSMKRFTSTLLRALDGLTVIGNMNSIRINIQFYSQW